MTGECLEDDGDILFHEEQNSLQGVVSSLFDLV